MDRYNEVARERVIWLMITKESKSAHFRYIRAGAPCGKGEIGFCLFGLSLTLGWQA